MNAVNINPVNIAIILLLLLILFTKIMIEPFDTRDQFVEDNVDTVVDLIESAIDSRKNANKNSKFKDEKYQNQIKPLNNALIYATYIRDTIA